VGGRGRGHESVHGRLGPCPGPVGPAYGIVAVRNDARRRHLEVARNFAAAHHLRQRPYPNTRSLRHEGVAFSQTHAV